MQRLFKPLVFVAVPLAAFITFLLQPIIGKLLMPRYGGSAGTWMTISMFFQAALLAGYALAYRLSTRKAARAVAVVGTLAVIAPLVTWLPPWHFPGMSEWLGVLTSLTLSLLPALLLTTSIGIILQEWIRRRHGQIPFYLYGISNLGSACALVIYPFLIETKFGLSVQITAIRTLLWILGLTALGVCWLEHRRQKHEDAGSEVSDTPSEPAEHVSGNTIAVWLAISFSTCTLMLGAINLLSGEIGSNPLSWLLPLGIYLLSFTVTFSGCWRPVLTYCSLVGMAGCLFGFMVTKGISTNNLSQWPRAWLVFGVMAACLAGHGVVYELRPTRRLSLFYLVLAIGGLLAGVFASVGAPALFSRHYEYTGASFFLLVFLSLQLLARESPMARYSLALMIVIPPGWFAFSQLRDERLLEARITHLRNHYGTLIVTQSPETVVVSSETTLHGVQMRKKENRRVPTTYYSHGSAVGIVLAALQESRPSIRIGAIGLGAGTLAAYPRVSDQIVFWEINPLAVKVARERFTFLKDCPGNVSVRLVDGRIGVRSAPEKFDAIVVDAFSGDSIPTHLITREALADYISKLDNGILLVHISNRYVDLFPVVAAGAQFAGCEVFCADITPNSTVKTVTEANESVYAVVYPPSRHDEVKAWFAAAEKRPDHTFDYRSADSEVLTDWTDDRHAIWDVFQKP